MKTETCCGCCSLKTGTIIVGALGIVLPLIFLILNFTTDVQQETPETEDLDMKIITIISYSVNIAISTLLIIGVVKKNTCLILPWLILGVIGIVGLCVNIFIDFIFNLADDISLNGRVRFIFEIITCAIYWHLWLVVHNYRKELLIEKMNNRIGSSESLHNYQKVAK